MSVTKRLDRWTWDGYLDWEPSQPVRYELVDGDVHAMTGGNLGHDTVANALRAELLTLLRGKPCRVQGPDLKVKAGHSGRYPDALIDCGPRLMDAVVASEPVAVFEVLSPGTAWVDQGLKMRDYDGTPTIRTYVLIEVVRPRALIYRRDESGHLSAASLELVEGADGVIALPDLGLEIRMASLYADVDLEAN